MLKNRCGDPNYYGTTLIFELDRDMITADIQKEGRGF